jgi:hypothetical protein
MSDSRSAVLVLGGGRGAGSTVPLLDCSRQALEGGSQLHLPELSRGGGLPPLPRT